MTCRTRAVSVHGLVQELKRYRIGRIGQFEFS